MFGAWNANDPADRLSYAEELHLGDACVARRKVTDLLEAEGDREPTAEEARIIREGDQAAQKLVQSYLPFIAGCARRVADQARSRTGTIIEIDDLLSRAVINAMLRTRSFNPRRGAGADDEILDENGAPKPKQPKGVRFAQYIERDIMKVMRADATTASSPFTLEVARVYNAEKWRSARENFIADFERAPTDAELTEITGLNPSQIVSPDRFLRMRGVDVDERPTMPVGDEANPHREVRVAPEYLVYGSAVVRALMQVIPAEDLPYLVASYGLFGGEVINAESISARFSDRFAIPASGRRWFRSMTARLTHPQGMARIARTLRSIKALDDRYPS